jgi:maltooligosyltrehalose trehalohydrolase
VEPPDPQAGSTFWSAKLRHDLRGEAPHRHLFDFYKELIALRKGTLALAELSRQSMEVESREEERVLILRRWSRLEQVVAVFHFRDVAASVLLSVPAGRLRKRLDSSERRWKGPGSSIPDEVQSDGRISLMMEPYCCVVFILREAS